MSISELKNTLQTTDINLNDSNSLIDEINSIDSLNKATSTIVKEEIHTALSQFKIAHALKKVHDDELYSERHSSFQEYIENELGFAKTKTYNLLKVAESYSLDTDREILEIGITKLQLIAKKINKDNIVDFLKENDVSKISFRKLQELVVKNDSDVLVPSLMSNDSLENNILKVNKKITNLSNTLNKFSSSPEEDREQLREKMYSSLIKTKKELEKLISEFEN